jgi:NAD(P)-dependent dehydrogenase (short-subunit alcohol dehydrogenase family)
MRQGDFEEAMAVHFRGPLHAMVRAIPIMRLQGGGRIVNVSSIGGKVGVPHLVPYCASTFALTRLSTSMRSELMKDGIRVTWFSVSDSLPLVSLDATRAARQIVRALGRGDAELIIGWPAKLAVVEGLSPGLIAAAMQMMNAFLPAAAANRSGDSARSGWQSVSRWAPSVLTRLTERAAADSNQAPTRSPSDARI